MNRPEAGGERHGAVTRVARQLGIGTKSLRTWLRQAEVDAGQRPGLTSQESSEPTIPVQERVDGFEPVVYEGASHEQRHVEILVDRSLPIGECILRVGTR